VWFSDVFRVYVYLPEGTLWQFNIAIENGPVEIVDLPIKNSDFP
jgi:hypothetical protein